MARFTGATGAPWSVDDIGDLTGRVALVTGANSGIGMETAVALAAAGAHVVLGCRSLERADRARWRIERHAPATSAEVLQIDLSDLVSVRQAAAELCRRHDRLDLLVNNAGVMGVPYRITADGFELQLATNHLGPFALTGLLADLLVSTSGSRVVTVSSQGHRIGRIDFDDLQWERGYDRWYAYGRTKLANLLFTAELDRRLRAAGAPTRALAAHPGWARSELIANGPGTTAHGLRRRAIAASGRLGQSAERGALPVLWAATARHAEGGMFVGPSGLGGLAGSPGPARASRRGPGRAPGPRPGGGPAPVGGLRGADRGTSPGAGGPAGVRLTGELSLGGGGAGTSRWPG